MRINLHVLPERRESILAAMRSLLGPTRVASGCLSCRLFVDVEDPNLIGYVEEWQDRQALVERLCAGSMRKLLLMLDFADSPPDVRFETVSETRGLEAVEEAWKERAPT